MRRSAFMLAAALAVVAGVVYVLSPRGPRAAPRAAHVRARAPRAPLRPEPPPSFARHMAEPDAGAPVKRYFHGVVHDGPARQPLAGAEILLCRGHRGGHDPCRGVLGRTRSEEDGSFILEARPQPEDGEEADDGEPEAEGDEPDDVPGSPGAATPGPAALVVRRGGFGPVIVTAPELGRATTGPGLTVTLWPGARLRGRVLLPDGSPVEESWVRWSLAGGRPSEARFWSNDGDYDLGGLPPGEVVLYAWGVDRAGDSRVGAAHVRLAGGEERRLDVVLDSPVLLVTGRLLDAQDRPIAGAGITAIADRPGDVEGLLARERRYESTSRDGRFALPFASAGPHRIRFRSGFGSDERVLIEDRLTAARPGLDQIVRVTRRDLLACLLLGADGWPAAIRSYQLEVERTDGGSFTMGSGPEGAIFHLLWPPGARRVVVELTGPAGRGRVELRSPAERCEASAAAAGG